MLSAETIAWVAMGLGIIGCSGATLILSIKLGKVAELVDDHLDRAAEDGHGRLV